LNIPNALRKKKKEKKNKNEKKKNRKTKGKQIMVRPIPERLSSPNYNPLYYTENHNPK
jgi:hypothetical protein